MPILVISTLLALGGLKALGGGGGNGGGGGAGGGNVDNLPFVGRDGDVLDGRRTSKDLVSLTRPQRDILTFVVAATLVGLATRAGTGSFTFRFTG